MKIKKKYSRNRRSLAIATALSVAISAMVIPMETQTVEAASVKSFSDVKQSHWAYSSIMKATQQGLVEGYNGKFNPNGQVTRAEFAKFLSRVFNGSERVQNTFSDIGNNHWASDAINEGIALGFIDQADFTSKKFNPNQAMTRNEIARWFVAGLVAKNPEYATVLKELESDLTLLPVAEFLKGGIAQKDVPYFGVVLGTGLMTGYKDYTIKPSGNTTRAEVVSMLFRYIDILEKDLSSFTDLNEFREVANTGTNILSITDYEKSKWGGYQDVLGKTHTFENGKGVSTIERAIFLDTTGATPKGAYVDMFYDYSMGDLGLNMNLYSIYYEYSYTTSADTNLLSMFNGTHMHFASPERIPNNLAEQFGIKTPKNITETYFKRGKKTYFWGSNGTVKGEVIDGITDDGSRFYYTIPR